MFFSSSQFGQSPAGVEFGIYLVNDCDDTRSVNRTATSANRQRNREHAEWREALKTSLCQRLIHDMKTLFVRLGSC
jgi:hypothetical protein